MGDSSSSAREMFAEACERAFADGVVDPAENERLRSLARDLAIPRAVALDIARTARDHGGVDGKIQRVRADAPDPRRAVAPATCGSLDRPHGEIDQGCVEVGAASIGSASRACREPMPRRSVGDLTATYPDTSRDEACAPSARSWVRWPARLWSRPMYTFVRLLDSSSPYRRARAIQRRISRLARRAPAASLLESVVDRVTTVAEILWDMDDELDQLVSYLARRGHQPPRQSGQGSRTDSPIDALIARRSQLSAAVVRMVGELERLEDRVAAYVLARRDGLPRRMETELQEALSHLEIVSAVIR